MEALGGLGPEEGVVAALIQSLQDHSLRYTAVGALGKVTALPPKRGSFSGYARPNGPR